MTAFLLLHHQHYTTDWSIIPVALSRIQFLAQLQLKNKLLLCGRAMLYQLTHNSYHLDSTYRDLSPKVILATEQPSVAGVSHLWAYLMLTLIYKWSCWSWLTLFIPWAHWNAGLITDQSLRLAFIKFWIFWRFDLHIRRKKDENGIGLDNGSRASKGRRDINFLLLGSSNNLLCYYPPRTLHSLENEILGIRNTIEMIFLSIFCLSAIDCLSQSIASSSVLHSANVFPNTATWRSKKVTTMYPKRFITICRQISDFF